MIYLNLSPGLQYTPSLACDTFVFNGGEPHLKIHPTDADRNQPVVVTVQARSANDLLLVVLAADALRRMGFKQIDLFIPYFPAARQDRVMVPGEPLSVRVFAALINQAGFHQVMVFDAHSEVTPALLDNGTNISNHQMIGRVIEHIQSPTLTLVAPDTGAAKKIHHLAAALDWQRVVQADKIRNVADGKLSGARVFADDLGGADCLIVDDICDGGGTFIQLAAALKAKNAGQLYLAVSHGIFSKGIEPLKPHFAGIYTTNSFWPAPDLKGFGFLEITRGLLI